MMGTQVQPSELEGILGQLLLPDNAAIQNAQAQLKVIFKNPDAVVALVNVLTTSQNEGVRQMAATMLRQRVTKSWMRLPADVKLFVKQTLITSVTRDPARAVRQAVARVISIIAKHEVPSNEWPDFMGWLNTCANSQELLDREIGMLVLSYVCEAMGEQLKPYFANMFPMFTAALQDTRSPTVPLYTIQTLSQLLPHFEQAEFEMLRQLLSGLIAVCKALVQHDEQEGVKAMEFFDELMDSAIKLTGEDITLIVGFFLELAANQDLEETTRTSALSHVVSITYTDKKKALLRSGVVPQIVNVVFNIMAEPYEDEDDEEIDEDEAPVPVHAGFIIQSFAMHLSATAVVPPALEVVGQAITSPDKYRRKASMVVLYMLVEGCSETLRPLLPQILPVMYKGLEDPEMIVREHACLALAEFSQWLQPQMSAYSAQVLPLLFSSLTAPVENVQIKSLYALNCFSDQLGDDIKPYLQDMMQHLSHMLQTGNQQIREHTVLAIAAAAVAAGKAFEPYLRDVYAYLKQLMALEGEGDVSIRAYATDTLGTIIKNMGKEYFVNDLNEIMNSAMAGLQLDDPEIHTCTFGLFGSLAVAFKDDFGPYLPTLIDVMVKYITNDEGIYAHRSAEDALANVDSDDEEDEVEAVTVDPSVMDAKQAAIDVLGLFATNCHAAFAPYLNDMTDVLLPLLKFDYSADVRKAAITTLCEFLVASNQVFPAPGEWQPGMPAPVPLSPQTAALAAKIMPEAIALMKVDYDRMVVLATTEGIDPVMINLGPAVFGTELIEAWCVVLADLMTGQASCQAADADDDEEGEKTVAEYDAQLIENACDLVGVTAKLMGPSFAGTYFASFAKLLHRYFRKNSTSNERSTCIGTFADIIGGMKTAIQPYVADLYDLLMKALADPEPEVRSNACFAIGLLCEYGGPAMQAHYMAILQKLHPLFTDQPVPELTDNACGAVCRMIAAAGGQLPLDKVLPVLISALPLKKDFIENETVFKTLLGLLRDGNQVAFQFLPQLLPVFADAYLNNAEVPKLRPETLVETTQLMKQLQASYPTEFQGWYGAMAPELQHALAAGLSA